VNGEPSLTTEVVQAPATAGATAKRRKCRPKKKKRSAVSSRRCHRKKKRG